MSDIGQLPSPAIGISLSVDVAKGRNLVFQTHVEQSQPLGFLNEQLDKLNEAADRQQAIYQIEYKEYEMRNDMASLADLEVKMLQIAEREQQKAADQAERGDRRPWQRSAPEQTHYDGLMETCKRLKMQIDIAQRHINELKAKVGERTAA